MKRTYQETTSYLYQLVPSYQKVGAKAIKKDLDNIHKLCAHLGHPHTKYPSIHIAGTNGKGSTAHMMSAILQSAGYKVGLYTSPHYSDFRERIKVAGSFISEEEVINFVDRHEALIKEVRPSFFEMTVAMAFDHFERQDVDVAVIETGLGGRLDSTNIITPLLSVITNISLDHQAYLGPDIYTIAHEKAGIIKQEVPVVVGRYQSSCDQVFIKKAAECNAHISFANIAARDLLSLAEFMDEEKHRGPFFLENATTASHAIRVLARSTTFTISDEDILQGLKNFRSLTNYRGRWTIHQKNPDLLSDSAHNPEAMQQVIEQINNAGYQRIHFILGFVRGKEVSTMLQLFDQSHSFYLTQPSPERALPVDELSARAHEINIAHSVYPDISSALDAAFSNAAQDDLIFVGGSSYLVGDLLSLEDIHFRK